jgi:hypothetical protein
MKREFASVLMLIVLIAGLLPAVAIGGNPTKAPGDDDKKGRARVQEDFLIDLTPSSRVVPWGKLSIVKYAISVKAMGNFRGIVELSLKGVPPGAIGVIDKSYGVPTFATILTVVVTPNAAEGVYLLTVVGKSGDIAHSAEAALVIGRGRNATTTTATATATTTIASSTTATTITPGPIGALMASVETDKQNYARGEVVNIRGFIRDSSGNSVEGASVSIQVDGPSGGTIRTDLVSTDSIGSFISGFTLPNDAPFGTYTIYVTASKEGYRDGRGQASFSVGESQAPAIAIVALYLSDMRNATKSSFSPGETLIVWVIVRNSGASLERGVIWAEVDDPSGAPLMVQFQIGGIGRGAEVRYGFSLTLSADAQLGAYRAKAFVSDRMISEGGKFLASQATSFAVAPQEPIITTTATTSGSSTATTETSATATSTTTTASTTTTTTSTTTTTTSVATTTTTATTSEAGATTQSTTSGATSTTGGTTTSETAETTRS